MAPIDARGAATPARVAALVLGGVELLGLFVLGWAPATVLLVLLADDLWCAVGTWLRTGWARTVAGEGAGECAIAIGGHALLDLVTVSALAASVVMLLPEGGLARLDLGGLGLGIGAGAVIALVALAAGFPRDRAGGLPDIDAIRRESRVLTRFLLFAIACALVLPWTSGPSGPALFAAVLLVVVRTAWVAWLGMRDLVAGAPAPAGDPMRRRDRHRGGKPG